MKKVLGLLVAMVVSANVSFADELKVAVVDISRIEQNALITKDLMKKAQAKEKPKAQSDVRFCPICGALLNPADSMCKVCGNKLRK